MDIQIPFKVLSVSEYDVLFEDIKAIPPNYSPEQILAILNRTLIHPAVIMQEINKESRDITNIYRVRVLKEIEIINDISDPQEFSYPPKECCQLQRCNFEGEPVFYGAIDANTPLEEAKKSIMVGKSICYLSKWGIKDCPEPLWCQRMFYGLPENEDYVAGIFSTALREGIRNILPALSKEQMDGMSYYLKKYQELFTSPGEEYYHITAAIVSDLFKNYHGKELGNAPYHINMPIFTYPSIARNKESMNYAVTTEFADKYLYLKYVDKIIVKSSEGDRVNYAISERGIVENGKVVWVKCGTKLLNDPFSEARLFRGEVMNNEYYAVKDTDHKFLRMSNDKVMSIRDYFKMNRIDLQEYINELSAKEVNDYNESNVYEKSTGIAIPVENIYIVNKDNTREKINAIGVSVHYSTGFHFD